MYRDDVILAGIFDKTEVLSDIHKNNGENITVFYIWRYWRFNITIVNLKLEPEYIILLQEQW